jgi:hypothetical protein
MAKIFFPSCQTKKTYPGASEKLYEYLIAGYGIEIVGCCRSNDYKKISPEDTAIIICNTCFSVLERISNAGEIISILEIIDGDSEFPFPNYNGEKITVQDCVRAASRNKIHSAVRSLLSKMNMEPIELNENREKSRFCGIPTFSRPVQNIELDPKIYGTDWVGRFKESSEGDRVNFIKEHVKQYTTDRAVSYCVTCDAGIKMAGKKSTSLINLLFNEII